MLEENLDGVKIEGLSDEELDKQLNENLGVVDDEVEKEEVKEDKVVDEKKEVEKTTEESSTEKKSNEDNSPSSRGEEDEEKSKSDNTEDEKKKNVPFHKHPRFQKLIKDKKELEEKNKEYEERLRKLENPRVDEELPQIPVWFAGDENDWKIYIQEQREKEEKLVSEAINKFNKQIQEKENKVKEMENWVDEEIDKLQNDPDIEEFNRNELLKIMTDYKPTDENGNLDFEKGYKLMVQLKKNKQEEMSEKRREEINAKKKIISTDKSTGSGNDEPKLVTAEDIRHKSFGQLL